MKLPDELAPKLRAAVERLLAEVGAPPPRDGEAGRNPRTKQKCWRCGGRDGSLTFHHLDDGSVVPVHQRCHRKIHGQAGGKSRKRRK